MNEFAKRRTWGPTPRYPLVEAYTRPSDQPEFIVVAGPCSVENGKQIRDLAYKLKPLGATHLRGGVFRAGTYPNDNFGAVEDDLIRQFSHAAKDNELQNIIEVLDYSHTDSATRNSMYANRCRSFFDTAVDHGECLQVGARQMQNYTLLKKLGQTGKTIFLKRNTGATLDEWLGAAEYIIKYGGHPVLVERGSSTHLNHVRWDLSVSMIPAVKAISKIPIILDASHGTGRRDLVAPMALAGVAAGADGLLIEVHEDPPNSLSDPEQAITPEEFNSLMIKVHKIRNIVKGDL